MKRVLVWDVPVRLFHWLLAGSFLGAFVIANVVDDESSLFTVHMWLGGIAVFMVLLRLVWGLLGSRHARFGAFRLSPSALAGYLKRVARGERDREPGHNPATSWAALAMFVLVLGLGVTGALMSRYGEALEEIHEVLAWALIAIVIVHVTGIVLHSLRYRENIALSMIDGRQETAPSAAIPRSQAMIGVVFVALTGLWAGGLYDGYDSATRSVTLPILGTTLALGEGEEEEGEHHERGEHEEYEEHDEHDEHDDD